MKPHDDTLYFEQRAEQEARRADLARDAVAAIIHRRLAEHYRERATRIVLPHLRVR